MIRQAAAGMRAMTPWLVGVVPFGVVIGIGANHAGVPAAVGWLTGPAIYAGSAQVAAIQMLDVGAAPVAVVATILVINLRLVFYSAAMARYWRGTPLWFRLVAGYLLIDPSFAVGQERYAHEPDRRRAHAYYLGGAILLWVSWLTAIAVGATGAARLPGWLHLEFVVPLYLIGEVVPKLRGRASTTAVLVAGGVTLAALGAPMHLGIAIGIIAGLVAAAAVQSRDLSTQEANR
jgi:predicted branched-subunit amino acid permease